MDVGDLVVVLKASFIYNSYDNETRKLENARFCRDRMTGILLKEALRINNIVYQVLTPMGLIWTHKLCIIKM
jgi:hypothetical protein